MKLKGFLVVSLVAVLGVFLVSGCCCPAGLTDQIGNQVSKEVEKSVKKSIEDTTGTSINTDKTKEVTGEDLKSVPRYPDSTRTLYIKGEPIDGNISVSLTYESSDDPATVIAFYKDKMAGLGWTVTLTVAGTDGGEMITWGKNDNATTATVNVTKNSSSNKTDIGIFYNGAAAGA